KTSLLRVLLGLQTPSAGSVSVAGADPGRAGSRVGYIPQQRAGDDDFALRGRDLVGLGLDGHRWGTGFLRAKQRRERVDAALAEVAASEHADVPIGRLSGGERQRLRVAQALVAEPDVLLCDEPLLALDVGHQRTVSELIAARKRDAGTAVLFVTHEINPVLPAVDRVLYLTNGDFRLGFPERVLTGPVLSELYGTPVEVLRADGRFRIVTGAGGNSPDPRPASERAAGPLGSLLALERAGRLLSLGCVQTAWLAAVTLGLVAGLLGPLIVMRGMAFAVHATAELAFTGAAAALLLGIGVSYR